MSAETLAQVASEAIHVAGWSREENEFGVSPSIFIGTEDISVFLTREGVNSENSASNKIARWHGRFRLLYRNFSWLRGRER